MEFAIGSPVRRDSSFSEATGLEPIAVSPKVACRIGGFSMSRLYQLLGAGELESYHEGTARRITVAGLRARSERLIAEAKARNAARADRGTRAA
jgi:hypothetical protein